MTPMRTKKTLPILFSSAAVFLTALICLSEKAHEILLIKKMNGILLYKYKAFPSQFNHDFKNTNSMSPIHYAASTGNKRLLLYLIKNKVDVNDTTALGNTPLSYAVLTKNHVALKILLSAGADANHINNYGRTALEKSILMCDETSVKILVRHGAKKELVTEVLGVSMREYVEKRCKSNRWLSLWALSVGAKNSTRGKNQNREPEK